MSVSSSSNSHISEQPTPTEQTAYRFAGNPLQILNDPSVVFDPATVDQWEFDYSGLPSMYKYADASCTEVQDLEPAMNDTPLPRQPLYPRHSGTLDHASEGDVPIITTHLASRSNTMHENLPGQPERSMEFSGLMDTPLYQMQCMSTAPKGEQPVYAADLAKSPTILQDPFRFQSPVTRRTSVSSNASGPFFSHYGTPVLTNSRDAHHGFTPSLHASFYSPPLSSNTQFAATWSPQLSAQVSTYAPTHQQPWNPAQGQRVAATMPSRRRPWIGHAVSGGPASQDSSTYAPSDMPVQKRRRAASATHFRPPHPSARPSPTNLPVPVFQQESAFPSPQTPYSLSPQINGCFQPSTPNLTSPYDYGGSRSPPTPQHQTGFGCGLVIPSEPPLSDFNVPSSLKPVLQPPQFEGDIYTPRYKRRNAKGEWEGWCGLCQPGQWHNLKNSRYWDDKLRNHGICARTKQKFEEPLKVRVVDLEGKVIDLNKELSHNPDMRGDEWLVSGVDGTLRKREGLCGTCQKWVAMDGARSKGKGKAVGWWSHAYKCHGADKKNTTPDMYQQSQPFNDTTYPDQTTAGYTTPSTPAYPSQSTGVYDSQPAWVDHGLIEPAYAG